MDRFADNYDDEVTGLPIEFGVRFYEFISTELIPYIDLKYKSSKLKVAVDHEQSSNLMNAFLLKDDPLFKAYVNLSPDFIGKMDDNC